MNRDTTFGIVGATVLIAAMVGVFAYERSQPIDAADEPAAPQDANRGQFDEVQPLSGTVAVADRDSQTFQVAGSPGNVTLHLTWTATKGKDTVRLSVTPPAGSNATAASSPASDSGNITMSVKIPAGASASGQWGVTVDFVKAEPEPLPGGVTPPVQAPDSTDTSVSYTVSITLD